ncbi:MAG: DUF3891 family protein [Chitinophagaceae bacterium]
MIVNYNPEGWEVITQRSHGLLAMQLAMEWKQSERPQRWAETLLSIAEHDDAEIELDGEQLLTAQGGPLNFDMKQFELDHCNRLFELSITKSRYIALLTSLHMDFLYKDFAKKDPVAKKFLQQQHVMQAKWRKELNITVREIKEIYSLLEWCDAFSLIICQDLIQSEQRSIEISQGPDNTKYQLYSLGESILTVYPWPFQSKSFTVHHESRLINKIKFKTSAEFRKYFTGAKVKENSWKLVKAPVPGKTKKV